MRVPLRLKLARARRFRAISFLLSFAIAAVFGILFWCGIESWLYPVIETMAVSSAVNRISESVSAAVFECIADQGLSYQDFITVEKDTEGRIASLAGNVASVSLLRSEVVHSLAGEFDVLREEEFGIPIGTLTGWMVFSGKGPSVRVELLSMGDVTVDMRHSLTSAGINQTLHQVYLDVSVTVSLMIPGEVLSAEVDSAMCVAETVILGQVPETYLYFGNGAE